MDVERPPTAKVQRLAAGVGDAPASLRDDRGARSVVPYLSAAVRAAVQALGSSDAALASALWSALGVMGASSATDH